MEPCLRISRPVLNPISYRGSIILRNVQIVVYYTAMFITREEMVKWLEVHSYGAEGHGLKSPVSQRLENCNSVQQ